MGIFKAFTIEKVYTFEPVNRGRTKRQPPITFSIGKVIP